ncbi:2,3-dihydro-2,3-dihydroxybenzoate dehydrogenase [Mesorhizobium sp. RMAD-H1]|uniref:2,3-dihydro-2,3-dihydroxybenzoate dehydrogenase n=1 Tax=Mesorhizobium sp. RMAD-H1 TaxID=2587065 RepID=UPI00161DC3B7|nr:2,3-dihydro-2,3-dihydroxybenzoate dehydrogenase [Mesorhizobium sp. RMAD-H1]MBB2972802.1 2,3-dihydro-2,3-dihydroxybenzoate dehydrogenase [Mesorhizobium sp. RMAD-H1]
MTQRQFAGRRVLVTGAARGIGRRIAERFVEEGADVTGLDRDTHSDETAFRLLPVDISDPRQVETVTDQMKAETDRLDVLVNAAGILRLGAADALTADDWRACIEVNAGGPFYLMRQWIPVFKAQRGGAIVNVASNAAHVPRIGMTAYCASKAALVSLSHCVGLELAPYGVRCNVVSPGSTDTPMLGGMLKNPADRGRLLSGLPEQFKLGIPLGKIATPDDIADMVLFLASDRAGHVTLQDVVVDGGATLGA